MMTTLGDLAIGDTFATDLPPYAAKVIGRHPETGAVLVHWRFGYISYAEPTRQVDRHDPPRTAAFDAEMERMRHMVAMLHPYQPPTRDADGYPVGYLQGAYRRESAGGDDEP